MAKDKLTQYDSVASGNLDVGGISVAEGMLPSGVNNAIREQMSHLADFAAGTSGVDVLKLQDDTDTNSIKLQAPASVTADTTFTMPDGDGSADQVLKTDGSGQLGWADRHANPSLIINGAMTVAQRGSVNSSDGNTVYTLDRWALYLRGGAAATVTKDTDVPSGQGFASSLKIDVTTGDALGTSNDFCLFRQRIEGQDLQHLKKGTASAESLTLSFWIKSTVTGTYILELVDDTNTRNIHKTYTVSSSDTWEYKTLTFAGDTTGTIDNDNTTGLEVAWFLGQGSDYTSGTLNTSWAASVNANRAVGQVNAVSSASNNILITGVKLEVGSTATDFVHESYGDTLERCQRYFQKSYNLADAIGNTSDSAGYNVYQIDDGALQRDGVRLPVRMRANPTVTIYNPSTGASGSSRTNSGNNYSTSTFSKGESGFFVSYTPAAGEFVYFHNTADAEL